MVVVVGCYYQVQGLSPATHNHMYTKVQGHKKGLYAKLGKKDMN